MALRGKMVISRFRILCFVCFTLLLPSCDEAPSQPASPNASKFKAAGFEAVITGAYNGMVSGVGVLKLLPNAGFKKQGYFFLSDGQGIRPFGVRANCRPNSTCGRIRWCFALSFEAIGPGRHGRSGALMEPRGNMVTSQFRILFIVCFALLLPSCDETPSQAESSAASKSALTKCPLPTESGYKPPYQS